ncbi:hypothetical protein DMUE_5318 [Dictyocoela muelleri]|nr:hypothetical protein DMUE_5318 [Dictyocoela muelleri]
MYLDFFSNSKRILMISLFTIILAFLFLIGFRMYGASVVGEANKRQTELIKKSPNFNDYNKKIFENIFKRFNEININCFLFYNLKATIRTINRKFENVEDLRKMKIEGDIKLNNFDHKIINSVTKKENALFIILNHIELRAKYIINEKSWYGSFYKLTGGYSLPDTLSEYFDHLQSLIFKLKKGKIGAAIFGDKIYVYFYNENENKVEDIYEIHGMDDKVTALDIFKLLIFVY